MLDTTYPGLRSVYRRQAAETLTGQFDVQHEAVLSRHGTGLTLLPSRFDPMLSDAIYGVSSAAAAESALAAAGWFGGDVDIDLMDGWLTAGAQAAAGAINDRTRELIAGLPLTDIDNVFAQLVDVQAGLYGQDIAVGAVVFGGHEGARVGGAEAKVWQVNSGNPRSAHAALSGQSVPIDGMFPNGMRWPKDTSGGASAEQVANCVCSLAYT